METDDESEQEAGCMLSRAQRWESICNMSAVCFTDGIQKGHSLSRPLDWHLTSLIRSVRSFCILSLTSDEKGEDFRFLINLIKLKMMIKPDV